MPRLSASADAVGADGRAPHVRTTSNGCVGELLLDRPEKLNALSHRLLEELLEAIGQLESEPRVKAVVVRGAGRAFTAGADLATIVAGESGAQATARRDAADLGRRVVDALAKMRAVTVAAIHGHCVGGGVVLATACDLRIAAEDARFTIPEVDLGIPLTWSGIPRLVRELGPTVTKDLVLTCRTIDAEEALRVGLVSRVVPAPRLQAEARATAEKLASQPSYALALTKLHVDAVAEESGSTSQSFKEVETLLEAARDPESKAAMERYLRARESRPNEDRGALE